MTGGERRDPASFTVGSEVAGYRLEEQIGRGGMAVVYRARDVQLGRNVALKLLSPALALDDAFRQRFIRESRAAAAVDHPYIIPIFAAGESDGVLFIAMRYVQGGDVRSLIDAEGPLPPDRAAGIITQVALALDAAHLHGLVHRDIKPANMLLDSVAGSDQPDHVYLADFGLSKRSLSVTGLTSIGQFLGTPAYVAPEQVEGRPVDSRADQYALACASFEILSGAPPYERDDDLAVMWAHVSLPPPSLSERRPSLPAAADAVLAKAMAKAPADRYPTCIAFAQALRQALGARVEPADLRVPEPGRPPTVVSGPAAGTPGEPAGPRAHSATEISRPRARPEAGSAAAADQGRPGVPGEHATPGERATPGEYAAPQPHAADPAEPSAPPYGAPPSRDAPAVPPDPERPPPLRPYEPPQPSFRPREPSAAPDDAAAAQRSGPPPASPYEPPASFRPVEPPASFRPREPSAAADDAAAAQRSGPPSASPYEPPASFRPREPSAARDEDPASSRSRPPPASPYEPPTEDGWLAPLRSFGGDPAGAGASPRQPPPYQPPRRESARTGP
ncbi:MAG: protein kinase, partial [Streptosporangiaceae bacterium]